MRGSTANTERKQDNDKGNKSSQQELEKNGHEKRKKNK